MATAILRAAILTTTEAFGRAAAVHALRACLTTAQRSSRGRDDDDYPSSSCGGRDGGNDSHQGWSGDSEGHTEAARSGWETRHNDDDHGNGNFRNRR